MPRPTKQELEIALKKAAELRETDQDVHYLAKSLLNHNYRLNLLNHVLEAADLYLHSGHGAAEHQKLQKAIEAAKAGQGRPGDDSSDDSNLML